jgi:hypothetical protein
VAACTLLQEFNEKYQFMLELQQTLHFFPPMKLITMWLNSGVLTGEKPKRMRRRRRMPETGLPPEPGEGYEPVQEDDFNSDDEVTTFAVMSDLGWRSFVTPQELLKNLATSCSFTMRNDVSVLQILIDHI